MNIQAISLEKTYGTDQKYLICYSVLIKQGEQLYWRYKFFAHAIETEQISSFIAGLEYTIFLGQFEQFQYDDIKCTEQHLEQLNLYAMSSP